MSEVKCFPFNMFQENTYLVFDNTGACIIIDPGCLGKEEQDQLVSFIESHNLNPEHLINTHCHTDHIFGNRFVSEKYGLPLTVNSQEMANIQVADETAAELGVPPPRSPGPGNNLEEGDVVKFGQTALKVLLTPGHSAGHITLWNEADQYVISGDVLFMGSIGRTDLPGGDYETLIRSIKEKLLPLGDRVTVFPGHGPETTIGNEKKINPFLV